MKRSLPVLALALTLTQRPASAVDTFRAVLLSPNEPPGSRPGDGGRTAFVIVNGTWLTFAVRLDPADRTTAVHLHKGAAVSGDIVLSQFDYI